MTVLRRSARILFVVLSIAVLAACGEEEVPLHVDHADCCGDSSWAPLPPDSATGMRTLVE